MKREIPFKGSGRVHFSVDQNDVSRLNPNSPKPGKLTKSLSFVSSYGLKRSKSLTSNDVLAAKAKNISEAAELGRFPAVVQDTLIKAIDGKKKSKILNENNDDTFIGSKMLIFISL